MKKVVTTLFAIVFTVLFFYVCMLGNTAVNWSFQMANMTHFDLHSNPSAYGEANLLFYTDSGVCYEAVAVPDGVTQDSLTYGLSLKDYDETVTSEGGKKYRLYRDPLQTGEGYVLIVPAVGEFRPPLTTISRPLGYYAREVKRA